MVRIATSCLCNRSALKTATYGVMHLTVAFMVAYALTGSWAIALSIGLIEPFVQTFFYNIHERAWERFGGQRARQTAHRHSLAA